jgi:hypothetical protein
MQVGLSVEGNLHLQQRPCVGRKCRSAAFVQSLCRLNIGKMSRMMTVMTPFSGVGLELPWLLSNKWLTGVLD